MKGMANDGKHMGITCWVDADYIVAGCIGDSCIMEVMEYGGKVMT